MLIAGIILRLIVTVTESEIREGILSMETSDLRCLWFKRNITDIHEQTTTPQLARYAGEWPN